MRKIYLIALSALMVLACETTSKSTVDEAEKLRSSVGAGQPNSTSTIGQSLAPRNLAVGECGLFVWAGDARDFILFVQGNQGARFAKDGQELGLTAVASNQSGDLYGQIPVQSFRGADGTVYDLKFMDERIIDDGISYPSGTWRYKDAAGWDVLTPVYGLSTCQTRG